MKRQSALVQQLKGKIQSLVNLVKLGVKKYIIQLLDLEARLADALNKQMIDSRIPQTLEDARKLSGIRFHEWSQASREMVQRFIDCAFDISNGTIYPAHPLNDEVRALTNGDGRYCNAIVTIAAKIKGTFEE